MSASLKVLVVDDEPAIHRFLRPALEASGYAVVAAQTAAEGLRAIASQAPDLVLLDLGLPDGDGKDVIRRARAFSAVPIIVLSARDREAEKVEALDAGADDYVEKPFAVGELLARLRAALRHAGRAAEASPVLRAGPVEIDVPDHRARLDGKLLDLTRREFDLLLVLVRHAGRVVTHRQLLTKVWGPAHVEDAPYLRVYVGQLRRKIEADPAEPRLLVTEAGVGYRFLPSD